MESNLIARVTTIGAKKAENELNRLKETSHKTEVGTGKMAKGMKIAKVSALALATSAVVVATSLGGATLSLANYNEEVKLGAMLSGTTTKQFEALSYAAGTVGMTAENLGDKFKDVNEKLGEFIAGKGGGLQDFIDVMGMSTKEGYDLAKSMEHLSGDQIIGELVKQMEAAGKSQKQMSWALEGLGSDLTQVIPLFKDGSKALNSLTAEFNAINNPLSDEDVEQYTDLAKNVDLLEGSFRSLANNALAPVAGHMAEMSKEWSFLIASWNEGTEANLTSRMADLVDEIADLEEASENAGTAWGRFTNVLTFSATTEDAAANRISTLKEELKGLQEQHAKISGVTAPEKKAGAVDTSPTKASIERSEKDKSDAVDIEKEKAKQNKLIEIKRNAEVAQGALLREEAEKRRAHAMDEYKDKIATRKLVAKQQQEIDAVTAAKEEANRQSQMSGLSQLTANLKTTLGEQSGIYKAAAITEATINTYRAAQGAYAALAGIPYVGPALGAAAAGVAIGAGYKNIQAITSARYQGGQLARGQASTVAENGEAEVIVPASNSKVKTMQQMNQLMGGGNGGGVNVNMTIIDQSTGSKEITTEQSNDELIVLIKDKIIPNELGRANSPLSKSLSANTTSTRRR